MKLPINELFHEGFYGKAADEFEAHRLQQISHGFSEYGKTYDPKNFTADEQLAHFMSELPDILHYGYGMYVTMKNQQAELADLKRQLTIANQELEEANHILDSLRK
jgi:hypothetical protein